MISESSRERRRSRRHSTRHESEHRIILDKSKRSKGKERAHHEDEDEEEGGNILESEDEDDFHGMRDGDGNVNGAGPSDYSSRVKRGWDTRRKRRAETVARQEDLVHLFSIERRQNVDDNSRKYPTRQIINDDNHKSTKSTTEIPTSALLQSLHHYSTAFYEEHGLLIAPKDKGRSRAWGSKKRIRLLRDATGTSTTSTTLSRFDDSDSESEGVEEGIRVKKEKMVIDEYGEIIPDEGDRGMDWKDGRKERSKGKYKLRDMRMSMDGSGLMALGILTQEIIIRKLHEAGYRRSPSIQTKRRKHEGKKKKYLDRPRDQGNDNDDDGDTNDTSERTELESEEGNGTPSNNDDDDDDDSDE